ncbi:MAG: HNH endonuclease [Pseudomonadota bacterium]
MARAWTRNEILIALNLYCQLPFGKLHQSNPLIIKIARLLERTPGSVAMKLSNLASLDPEITASGRKGLEGASGLDKAVWSEFINNPDALSVESQQLMDDLVGGGDTSGLSSDADVIPVAAPTEATTTSQSTIKIRRGQAFFRKAVLASYDSACCMSNLRVRQLLVASHIKPWSADIQNRLNPKNGLCLSALHDRAYDLGYISVKPDLSIAISKELAADQSGLAMHALKALDGHKIRLPEKFPPSPDFLDWHHKNIFLG